MTRIDELDLPLGSGVRPLLAPLIPTRKGARDVRSTFGKSYNQGGRAATRTERARNWISQIKAMQSFAELVGD